MLPYGIDISRYNYSSDGSKKVDFDIMAASPVVFVAIRAGISWGYSDPWFARSWSEAKRVKLPRLAYHVPYFSEDATKQMDNFFRIIGADCDWTYDRLVIDAELEHSNTKATITTRTKQMLEICKARTGRYPIIYSRAEWVNRCMSVADMPKVDWWLAHYRTAAPYPLYTLEKEPPPLMPIGVTSWLIHQTGEKSNGGAVGVASYYVDSNRWNGTQANLQAYFGYSGVIEPPSSTVPSLEDKVNKLWGAHPELH